MDDVLIDRLRAGLADAADGIDPGDAGAGLPAMHHSARRRRRRNVVLGAACCVALAVAGAAIVASVLEGEADTVRTVTPPTTLAEDEGVDGAEQTPSTTVPATTTTVAETPTDAATPTDAVDGATGVDGAVPTRIVGTSRTAVGQSVATPSVLAEPAGHEFLVPWQDGFLAGRVEGVTPSTPLSDELFALLPQEIRDLFPDGVGAPTVEENAAIIAEAELTLQAMDALGRNPELEAAVYSRPQYSVVQAEFSVDGETWEPVAIEVPPEVALIESITTVGDRLVVIGTPPTVNNAFPTAGGIASTTDLVDWTIHTIPVDLPTDLPDTVVSFGGGDVVAALTETGWVATVEIWAELELAELLPESLDASGGYGTSEGPDGLVVEIFDEQGEITETAVVPWDELGVDWATLQRLHGGPEGVDLYTATWDGDVTPVDASVVNVRPVANGYLGDVWDDPTGISRDRFSLDGRTWGPVPEALERKSVMTTFSVEDATIVVALDQGADLHLYRVTDANEPWQAVDVDGVPPTMNVSMFTDNFVGSASQGGAVVDGAEPFVLEYESTVEADGRRLTMLHERRSASYRVVDIATSDELAAETVDLREVDDPWRPFDGLVIDYQADTITITHPQSGDVVARFPAATVIEDQGRAERDYFSTRHDRQDAWLVVTADGIDWIVVDLDEADDEFGDPRSQVAVNGAIALVDSPAGWLRYEL